MHARSLVAPIVAICLSACVRRPCCDETSSSSRGIPLAPSPQGPAAEPKPPLTPEAARLHAIELRAELETFAPAARGARVQAALADAPTLVGGLSPGEWVGLAPDFVRAYDVSALAAAAPDMPVTVIDFGADAGTAPVGPVVEPRVVRFADEVRAALPSATVLVHPTGAVLVVGGRPDEIDAAVARASRVGSGIARVETRIDPDVDHLRAALGIEANNGTWKRVPASSRLPGGTHEVFVRTGSPENAPAPDSLALAVPSGCRFGSKRTMTTAYLQDFDTEGLAPWADPIIGRIESGLSIHVTKRAGDAEGPDTLLVDVAFSALNETTPPFTTTANGNPVSIDLPELHLVDAMFELPAVVGAEGFIDARIAAFLVRVTEVTPTPAVPGPLVRRIASGESAASATASRPGSGATLSWVLEAGHATTLASAQGSTTSAAHTVSIVSELDSLATTTFANQLSYIQDVDVEVHDGAATAHPIIGTIPSGIEAGVRAHSIDAGHVVASAFASVSDVDRPIRAWTSLLGPGAPVNIQLPRTHQVRESFARVVAPGESIFWSIAGSAGARERATLAWRLASPGESPPAAAK